MAPLSTDSSIFESVPSFRYLGSFVENHGKVAPDLDDKVAKASRAFGALRKAVFQDSSLSRQTKKMVYQAVVLGVLCMQLELGLLNRRILEDWRAFTIAA